MVSMLLMASNRIPECPYHTLQEKPGRRSAHPGFVSNLATTGYHSVTAILLSFPRGHKMAAAAANLCLHPSVAWVEGKGQGKEQSS